MEKLTNTFTQRLVLFQMNEYFFLMLPSNTVFVITSPLIHLPLIFRYVYIQESLTTTWWWLVEVREAWHVPKKVRRFCYSLKSVRNCYYFPDNTQYLVFTAAQLGQTVAVLDYVEPSLKGILFSPISKHEIDGDRRQMVWKRFSKQVPNGVWAAHASMSAAFPKSSCIRRLCSALRWKMHRSTAGRFRLQSATTGR